MKTYRIASMNLTIDIAMPSVIFWLFKRYAKIKTYEDKQMHGRNFDYVIFDELKDESSPLPAVGGKANRD